MLAVVATVLALTIANCQLLLLEHFVGATVCGTICGSNGLWVQRFVGAICGSNRNLSNCNFVDSCRLLPVAPVISADPSCATNYAVVGN